MFAALLLPVALAVCPSSDADLVTAIDHAESAFIAMDVAAFRADTDEAGTIAGCLSVVPPRATIARLHRVEALRAFVDQDPGRTTAAFRAARAIEPSYALSEELIPAGHPVRQVYKAADPAPNGSVAIAPASDARVLLDGIPAVLRPTDRPALVLIVGDDGAVRASAYAWQGDPLPYSEPLVASQSGGDHASAAGSRKGPNVPLTVTAGLSVGLCGTMLVLSRGSYDAYHEADAADPDREAIRTRTNAYYGTFVGAGVVALGTGIGAVAAGHW